MAYVAADGVLGLEARHLWRSYNPVDEDVYLNQVWDDTGAFIVPHVQLKSINGLHDLPDVDDNREPNTERIGERVFPSRARGKTVTYSGLVRAASVGQLRNFVNKLRQAFGPDINTGLNETGQMFVLPHPAEGGPDPTHTYYARCMTFVCPDDHELDNINGYFVFRRSLTVGLRLHDPRLYLWDGSTQTTSAPKW